MWTCPDGSNLRASGSRASSQRRKTSSMSDSEYCWPGLRSVCYSLAQVHEIPDVVFRRFIMELGVLTLMIIALVVSLVLLRNRKGRVAAERAIGTKSTTPSEPEDPL